MQGVCLVDTMSTQSFSSCQSRQAGFSLIEVLVALVILSVGVVGVAGVQLGAIKFNQVSQQRSLASQYALSIAELMRANLAAVAVPAGTVPPYIFDFQFADIPANKPVPQMDCKAGCTAAQVARNKNLNEWLTQLAQALPEGRGTITRNAAVPGAPYVVTVMWKEKELTRGGGGFLRATDSCPPVGTPTDVQCVRLEFQP